MKILVLNSGSSSLKYKVFGMPDEVELVAGQVERIGETVEKSIFVHSRAQEEKLRDKLQCPNHRAALEKALDAITDTGIGCVTEPDEIGAIGHRVVHGRDVYTGPTRVSGEVISKLKEFIELAPLHMPANISCIEACMELLPKTPQVANFDTSFYQTMPKHAYLYPVPLEWHEKYAVRRYGFHGISHQYVTHTASEMLGIPLDKLKLITAHLGAGASITAFDEGRVLDTSMGFTPLEGLMMGTRVGYLDPAVIPYMVSKTGASVAEIERTLNNESGLAAISGISRDMRNILEERKKGNERAELAFRMFVHTLRKYIGAYYFAMGGADAIVFTAGIGENSPEIRQAVCENLEHSDIIPDREKNEEVVGGITAFICDPSSPIKLLVIPTDEEVMIARETYGLVQLINFQHD